MITFVHCFENNWMRQRIISLLNIIQFQWIKLFSSITIETTAFCNRKCEYCPNNDKYPNREKGLLEDSLYYSIIEQLSDMKFSGRISPHLYGEPLLDKRLLAFIQFTREKCSYAQIVVYSNGDFLTSEKMTELIDAGMDEIYVTCYDEKNENLEQLDEEFGKYMSFRYFKYVPKRNKAGLLQNVEKVRGNMDPCLRPSSQLVVNWAGDVVLCCNDYYGKLIFGNVSNMKILDIWFSKKYKSVQSVLSKEGGRGNIDLCKTCDG